MTIIIHYDPRSKTKCNRVSNIILKLLSSLKHLCLNLAKLLNLIKRFYYETWIDDYYHWLMVTLFWKCSGLRNLIIMNL